MHLIQVIKNSTVVTWVSIVLGLQWLVVDIMIVYIIVVVTYRTPLLLSITTLTIANCSLQMCYHLL